MCFVSYDELGTAMKNTKGRGIQLLLAVIAVSAISVAIGSGRQKTSQAATPASTPNLAQPPARVQHSRRKILFLSIAAFLILAVDAFLVWKAGDVAANAVGSTLVAIGATLLLLSDTDAMGVSKRNWRRWAKPGGNLFAAFGAGAILCGAWQVFFEHYPWPWPWFEGAGD